MLDLQKYTCLGAALRDALNRFANEVCLIEAERDREKVRLTYSDFKEIALPLTRALEDADFGVCHFLLWRSAGSHRLQIDRGRASPTPGALEGQGLDR